MEFSIGSYLDTPTETIEKRILTHPYCNGCMRHGLHTYALWHGHAIRPEYERIAQEEIRLRQATDGVERPGSGRATA
jgi:hypothetical protein